MSLEQNQPLETDVVPEHDDEKSVNNDNSEDVTPMDTGESSKSVEEIQNDEIGALMADPNALEALVSTLPGVDTSSQVVQQAMAQAKAAEEKTAKKKDKKDKDKEEKK